MKNKKSPFLPDCSYKMAALLLGFTLTSMEATAAPQPKPPCGTSGALSVTDPTPSPYSYISTASGAGTASFKVTSPSINSNGNCDSGLSPVYGNGNSGSDIDVTVSVATVTVVEPTGGSLTIPQETALRNAITLTPSSTKLTNPGTGSFDVDLDYVNTAEVPVGKYDVAIDVTPEPGTGVGAPESKTFTVIVTEPTVVDTLAPTVNILSPANNPKLCLNGDLAVSFTATDPEENGAGTGITDVRAAITSNGGSFNSDLTSGLTVAPSLSVPAGVEVSATTSWTATKIGGFLLSAEADDNASHTGEAVSSYTVGLNVNTLPPMSVAGRQFKVGSTLPIKWTFTDCEGNLLPPYETVSIKVTAPNNNVDTRVLGDGASNIRWELDTSGNVLHYITNYSIPVVGSYNVDIYVDDIDGKEAKQGTLSFIASTKGGK